MRNSNEKGNQSLEVLSEKFPSSLFLMFQRKSASQREERGVMEILWGMCVFRAVSQMKMNQLVNLFPLPPVWG